jgi:hypothetical protein
MVWRRNAGGIESLLEIEEKHTVALYSDFRRHYSISYDDVGNTVSWREAVYLVEALTRDPSSMLCAAIGDWKHPASFEWMMLANLFDLTLRLNSKKGDTMDRPWTKSSTRVSPSRKRSREEIDGILNKMNPGRRQDG